MFLLKSYSLAALSFIDGKLLVSLSLSLSLTHRLPEKIVWMFVQLQLDNEFEYVDWRAKV